jgi:hypothetical protein
MMMKTFELGEETQSSVLQPFRLLIGQTGNNAYSDHGTLVTTSYKDKTNHPRGHEDDSTTLKATKKTTLMNHRWISTHPK